MQNIKCIAFIEYNLSHAHILPEFNYVQYVTVIYHFFLKKKEKNQEKMESHCLHFAYCEVAILELLTYRRGLLNCID